MPKPQFFLQNGRDPHYRFSGTRDLFDKGTTTVSRWIMTGDSAHPACMAVSAATDETGVEKVLSNVPDDVRHVCDFDYRCSGAVKMRLTLYDNVGGATIHSATLSGTNWANYRKLVTTPANCSVVLIKLLRNNATVAKSFRVDDFRFQGNALLADPDDYSKTYPDITFEHKSVNGNITQDRQGRHVEFNLGFPMMTASAFNRLLDASKAKEPCYFDDRNVPVATVLGTIFASRSYTFNGVTKAMASVNAWQTATTATYPIASTAMQSTEFVTADYTAIGADDAAFATLAVAGTGDYGYHKFYLKASTYTTTSQVKKLSVTYKGECDDASTEDPGDGIVLYGWDGTHWAMLARSRTSDKQTLSFSTSRKEIARKFVDTSDNSVRLIAKTRSKKASTGDLTLKSYYVAVSVNDDLSMKVQLRNKAVLSATGAMVSVKNLTTGSTLMLNQATTGYKVLGQATSIEVTSDQAVSSVIEAKHNQYYKVAIESLSQGDILRDSITQPHSRVSLRLKTLTPIED